MTLIEQINTDFFLSALISIICVLRSNQRSISFHNCEAIKSAQSVFSIGVPINSQNCKAIKSACYYTCAWSDHHKTHHEDC